MAAEHRQAEERQEPLPPDLRPVEGDVEAEVERLIGLGARHLDVGQKGTENFVVLADPEDNEFRVEPS